MVSLSQCYNCPIQWLTSAVSRRVSPTRRNAVAAAGRHRVAMRRRI